MIVEELVAKLGLRATGLGEAKKFTKALEEARKAAKGLDKSFRVSFLGTTGIGRVAKDFDRAAAAARRFREEASRPVRSPRGGYGGYGGYGGGYGPRGGYSRRGGHHNAGGSGLNPAVGAAVDAAFAVNPAAGMAAGMAVATGLAARKATKDSMDFERSLITVGKATDTSGEGLRKYGKELQDLARQTGKGQNDLAEILSAAGFAGRPQEELMRFTEFGAKAAVAWQTSSKEAAQGLAEIGNIYGANQERIEVIADAINKTADSSASQETDLLDFITRAGASAKEAGMSAEQILPFAAAMKEVGVRTDVAATGFEALLNVMKLGEEFSKSAGDGLKELGYDSTKMRKAFVAKPLETTLELLEKLKNISDPLKKAEIMTNLFGKEYQDDIAKLLNGLPQILKYQKMLSDSANFKGDTRKQFAEQLNFDVSKIDQASQSIEVLSTRLGNYFKLVAGAGAEKFNVGIDYLEGGGLPSVAPDTSDAKLRELNGMPTLISGQQFGDRFGTGPMSVGLERASMHHRTHNGLPAFTRLPGGKYAMDYQKAPEPYYPPTLGATPGSSFGIGGAKSGDWMRQATSSITNHYENTGNDQRHQHAHVTVNATGLDEVASQVRSQVQSALSTMGPSIAKANTTPTSGASLTSP